MFRAPSPAKARLLGTRTRSLHSSVLFDIVCGRYANGIANGSRLFFQDIENYLNDSSCFKPGSCRFNGFTDLFNLFAPALAAGACATPVPPAFLPDAIEYDRNRVRPNLTLFLQLCAFEQLRLGTSFESKC
jgi:hypothetical protein